MDNQAFEPRTISQVFGARGQTQPSIWSSRQSENYKPKPSSKIRSLIGRLGLRYHPANAADLSSHQAMLGLLAEDLAHIDPDALGRAIDRHVMSSPYMPKAADLIKLAQAMQAPQTTLDAYAEELNELRCTRANGWRWQVRTNAEGQRYLDRNDGQEGPERWQPREGEGRATQEVAAILVEQGTGQRLFDDMVRRGAVSRMVDDHLSGS